MNATPETKAADTRPRMPANNPKRCAQATESNDRSQRHFSPDLLESLRNRLPEYLAARGVELRRNGSRLVGKCPAHDDASPSFAVFGSHQETCGCYPCNFTGDVFAVSQWLGRSSTFPEAVQDVAATLGVYLPQSTAGTAPRPAPSPRHWPRMLFQQPPCSLRLALVC